MGAKRSKVSNASVPPEIASLIKGRSVRIEPGRYYSKLWMTRLPLVQGQVTQSDHGKFTLKPEFFDRFLLSLLRALRSKRLELIFEPSDWIAEALVDAATPARHPNESTYEDRSQTVSVPSNLEEPFLGRRRDPNTFEIVVGFRPDPYDPGPDAPPLLEISVVGERARLFSELRDARNMVPSERRQLERDAGAVWKFLAKQIEAQLGVKGVRGRPTTYGAAAAYFKDHLGLKWLDVAKRCCRDKRCKDEGKHDHSCQDKFRKAAELYWKREQKEYADLAKAIRSGPQTLDSDIRN